MKQYKRNKQMHYLFCRLILAVLVVISCLLSSSYTYAQYVDPTKVDESVDDIFDKDNDDEDTNVLAPEIGSSIFGGGEKQVTESIYAGDPNPPFLVQADGMAQDKETGVLVAQGNVEISYGIQVMRADEVIYYPQQDIIEASGNVSLLDEEGNVYFAETMKLSDKMKKAFITEVYGILSDGSYLAARKGRRIAGKKTEMDLAVFSPCDLCRDNPDKAPIWRVKATKVIHDEEIQDIIYHNARMEMFGIPVFYTPYLSHPAPNVTRRSGVLKPSFGFSTKHGSFLDGSYYHVVDKSEDATMRVVQTGKSGTMVGGEWRKRFDRGKIYINASVNRSERRDADDNVIEKSDWRGHLFSNGQYDINDNWKAGYTFARATDPEYLEDFYISRNRDVLANTFYAQRLKGRDKTDLKTVYFYDLRPNASGNQPQLLPWLRHSMVGKPNELFGGRTAADIEVLSMVRDNSQSVYHLSARPSWSRETVFSNGLLTRFDANTYFDSYTVNNPTGSSPDNKENYSQGSIFGNLHVVNQMPFINPTKNGYAIVTPKLSLTVAPYQKADEDIPNEDSKDAQLDYSNLFDASRYPGNNRRETGTHTAYGIEAGFYSNDQQYIMGSIGQSYRISGNPAFPVGSGLEERRSDIVGNVQAQINENLKLNYNFQFEQGSYASRWNEIQANLGIEDVSLSTSYLQTKAIAGTDITNREQITLSTILPMNEYWRFNAATLYNLEDSGSRDKGILKAQVGFTYEDECFTFASKAYRNFTETNSNTSELTILFTLGFKKLGEFLAPAIDDELLGSIFGSDDDNN